MTRFIVRRLAFGLVVVWLISIVVFSLSRAAGDPRNLYLTEYVTKEQWDAWGRQMGLDRPLPVQYAVWLGKAITGDFGTSLKHKRDPLGVIGERLPATLQLGAAAFLVAITIGIPFGVVSAIMRGSALDYAARVFALLGQAMPVFWLGIMLILIFAVELHWFPTSRRGGINHFVLPTLALGWLPAASLLRITRSAMLNVLDSEFIKLARAKGCTPQVVIWKHAFRNALIAPLTLSALILASFLSGAVVIETVFAWPGVGSMAIGAINSNDFPLISAVVMMFASFYIVLNLLVDLAYARIDPRIRLAD